MTWVNKCSYLTCIQACTMYIVHCTLVYRDTQENLCKKIFEMPRFKVDEEAACGTGGAKQDEHQGHPPQAQVHEHRKVCHIINNGYCNKSMFQP
jgi:hypothetical protein